MSRISKNMSLQDFAVFVAKHLKDRGIDVVLTGGAVVSLYSNNAYKSNDLDFLSTADHERIVLAMVELGFEREGKDFCHPDSQFYVEFPGRTLVIGEQQMKPEGKIRGKDFILKLLSPTQCVMDRLAAFYHWNDRQSLDQAILVAKYQPVKLSKIKSWSAKEGMSEKFELFQTKLKSLR